MQKQFFEILVLTAFTVGLIWTILELTPKSSLLSLIILYWELIKNKMWKSLAFNIIAFQLLGTYYCSYIQSNPINCINLMVDSSSYFIWRPFISLSPWLSKLAGVRLPSNWSKIKNSIRKLLGKTKIHIFILQSALTKLIGHKITKFVIENEPKK